jgi:hypothetical protein
LKTTTYSSGIWGSRLAVLISTTKQAPQKPSALFQQGRFSEMFSFLKYTLQLLAVKSFCIIFTPLKPQGGNPGFKMNIDQKNSTFSLIGQER